MTLLTTTCIAFAIIRFFEEGIRFCINLISRLTSRKKAEKAVNADYKRLTANVAPEFYELVKQHCAKIGVTVTQYTFRAVERQLKEDGVA